MQVEPADEVVLLMLKFYAVLPHPFSPQWKVALCFLSIDEEMKGTEDSTATMKCFRLFR
jgi:hypothetical protein